MGTGISQGSLENPRMQQKGPKEFNKYGQYHIGFMGRI